MIEQIQKFTIGGSARDQLAQAQARYASSLATMPPERDKLIKAFENAVSSYQAVNPTYGRSGKLNQAQVLDFKTYLAQNGTYDGYQWDESTYQPIQDFIVENNKVKTSSAPSVSAQAAPAVTFRKPEYYKPFEGLYKNTDDTLLDRLQRLAKSTSNQIKRVKGLDQSKYVIRGNMSFDDAHQIGDTILADLNAIANGEKTVDEARAFFKTNFDTFKYDQNQWDNYIENLFNLSDAEKAKKALTDAKWTELTLDDIQQKYPLLYREILQGNEYKVMARKSGENGPLQYRLYDKDYNPLSTDAVTYINGEYGSNYGKGFAIDASGYVLPDQFMLDLTNTIQKWKPQIEEYIRNQYTTNSGQYSRSQNVYNISSDYSNDNDLIHKGQDYFNGRRVLDATSAFDTNEPIYAIDISSNNNFKGMFTKLGDLQVDHSNIRFIKINPDTGQVDKAYTGKELEELGIHAKYKREQSPTDMSTAWVQSGMEENLPLISDTFRTRDVTSGWGTEKQAEELMTVDKSYGSVPGKKITNTGTSIEDSSALTIAWFLLYTYDKEYSELNSAQQKFRKQFWSKDLAGASLGHIFKVVSSEEGKTLLQNPKIREAYYRLLQNHSDMRESGLYEQGGVLKAQNGTEVTLADDSQNYESSIAKSVRKKDVERKRNTEMLRTRADSNNRTLEQQRSIEEGWNTQDTLRVTALAADIAGLVMAASGAATAGSGSIASTITGVGSTALDTIADFTDDGVSRRQAWTNLGLNLAMTAGAAFGARAPKVAQRVIKLAPKILNIIGTAGIVLEPSVHNAFKKCMNGEHLDMGDWRAIMNTAKMATNIATTRKINKKAQAEATDAAVRLADTKKNMSVTSDLDPNIVYMSGKDGGDAIPVPKHIAEEVNAKLNTGKEEDLKIATELLTRSSDGENPGAGLTQQQAKDIIETVAGEKKGWDRLKFWKDEPDATYKLREANSEQIRNATGKDVDLDARLKVIEDIRAEHEALGKGLINRLNKRAIKTGRDAALNQVLAGRGYFATAADFEQQANKELGPTRPRDFVGQFEDLDAETRRLAAADYETQTKNLEAAKQAEAAGMEGAAKAHADADVEIQRLTSEKDAISAPESTHTEKQQNKISGMVRRKTSLQSKIQETQQKLDEYRTRFGRSAKPLSEKIATRELKKAEDALKAAVKGKRGAFTTTEDGTKVLNMEKVAQIAKKDPEVAALLQKVYDVEARKQWGAAGVLMSELQAQKTQADADFIAYRDVLQRQGKTNKQKIRAAEKQRHDLDLQIEQQKNLKSQIDNGIEQRKQDTAQAQSAYDNAKLNAEQNRFASRIGQMRSDAKISTSDGTITIPKNTDIISYTRLRGDTEYAKQLATRSASDRAVELTPEQLKSILTSNSAKHIRGGIYDPDTQRLTLWKQGGNITSKYKHLR